MAAGYNPTKQELLRLQAAFKEAKAEDDHVLVSSESDAFVHTKAYRDALEGQKSLLIGRKGSGKTALLLGYKQEQSQRYLASGTIDIRADDFPLEALFQFIYADSVRSTDKASKRLPRISDLPAFTDPVRLSAYAWAQSLRCAAVYVTASTLLKDKNLNPNARQVLARAKKSLDRYMGPRPPGTGEAGSEVVFSLLIYFFQNAQAVIDNALGIHTTEIAVILAAITRGLTSRLAGRLDHKIEDAARVIGVELEHHEHKCLLTLDKFDDYYDQFYRQSQKQTLNLERREFLAALLHGLVLATRDIKRDQRFRWLHTLFAIPMDKFLELHLRERAELEQSHVLRLEWTPGELFEYVNKRIAYALDLPDSERQDGWNKLFPFEVTNGTVKDVKEHSFLYVLRHTMWKPRELQMYVRAILERMDDARTAADEETFRKAVKAESEQIIRREFIEEFMSEYPGMPGLMKRLEGLQLKSVMPYAELCDRVAGVRLFDESMTASDVMIRLFHMGIVGVRQIFARERRAALDPTVTQNHQEVSYRFAHNCDLNDPFSAQGEVVFHPMFFHYLDIKHEQKYVVNQLAWEMFAT